jgi:putative FmdB family regulatory protein
MPIYEYQCGDCRRRVSLFYQSISLAAAQQAEARCPHCGGAQLRRLVSRFSVIRPDPRSKTDPVDAPFDPDSAEYGEGSGPPDDGMGGMGAYDNVSEQMMAGMDDEDPRSIARWARQMQAETGEDLGPEFNAALGRIESGEDPDRVMEDMEPALAGDGDAGGFDDDG